MKILVQITLNFLGGGGGGGRGNQLRLLWSIFKLFNYSFGQTSQHFNNYCDLFKSNYYTDIDRDGHEISRFFGCQENYIFPRDYIFPKCAALRKNIVPRENITILAPPTRDISSIPIDICYIRWSKWIIKKKKKKKKSAYAVHFMLGQFPNMELMLLSLFYLLNCYIVAIASL